MKVLLTGSTGFIGHEVLQQCLHDASITSIVALSRRELPSTMTAANSKLKTVIMQNFLEYSEDVVRELQGVDTCIWSLGKAMVSSDEEARRISFGYTMAAVRALQSTVAHGSGRKIRFVYLSGKIAERDQSKQLWYMQEHRRIRGQLENDLVNFAREHQDTFETYVAKPSMVLKKDGSLSNLLFGALIPTIRVDVLAKAMVAIATSGHTQQTFENADLNFPQISRPERL